MRHIPFNDLNALEQTLSCLQFTGDDAGRISFNLLNYFI
jgi:hypothetical protein